MTVVAPSERADLTTVRADFVAWLAQHRGELEAARPDDRSLESELHYTQWLLGTLWDAGFNRWGWPSEAGGTPGAPILRGVVAEELTFAGLANQNMFTMPEILAAPFGAHAPAHLVGDHLHRYLVGEEWWCQGFSEPGAGSDLANLETRAVLEGDHYVVSGQKVWTTLAHLSERCILLARTGPPGSAHRGITAFFVDVASPGFSVRPIRSINGDDEFSELFLDEVQVPADRVLGAVDGGWQVAMDILACERAAIFWARAAWLLAQLDDLVAAQGGDDLTGTLGHCYQLITTLRARSRRTQHAADRGTFEMSATSIDKALMAASEQALFDAVLELRGDAVPFGDDAESAHSRNAYVYSRAASIYGGTSEIQRNIIAERLLSLPREPR